MLNKFSYFKTILFFVLVFSFSACNNTISFQGSEVVPAAIAEAKIKQDQNNNYEIEIEVENLAKPENLHPPKDIYLAWYESEGTGANKLGQIKISKNLSGSLETVVPNKPTRLFITAEENTEVSYPSSKVILETEELSL